MYGMTTPAEQLAADMLKPATISNDGVSVGNRSLTELMEYEKHVASKAAAASPAAFLRKSILKIVPPGGH
jgi:hypothetical protein